MTSVIPPHPCWPLIYTHNECCWSDPPVWCYHSAPCWSHIYVVFFYLPSVSISWVTKSKKEGSSKTILLVLLHDSNHWCLKYKDAITGFTSNMNIKVWCSLKLNICSWTTVSIQLLIKTVAAHCSPSHNPLLLSLWKAGGRHSPPPTLVLQDCLWCSGYQQRAGFEPDT